MRSKDVIVKQNKNITNDTNIVIRCTTKDKDRIKNKADSLNVSLSQYMLDASIAGTEKKSVKEHRRIRNLIDRTEVVMELNRIKDIYTGKKSVSIPMDMLEKIVSMEEELWVN